MGVPNYNEFQAGKFAWFVTPIGNTITSTVLRSFGLRLNISVATNGDDIWPGTATTLPIPPDAGEQMQLQSTSASDAAAGIGVQTIHLHYLDNTGTPNTETVTMNGVTPVLTLATNIRFVQEIHTITAGSNLLAVGTITISTAGVPATVYTQIQPGTNQSLNTARMVPAGKTLLITDFNASSGAAAGGKSADIRLRVTSHEGSITPRIFHFADNFLGFSSGTDRKYSSPVLVPSLSIVKCTSYTTAGGSDVQASWEGFLINNPT